jgi:hypothetical protein
MKDECLFQDKTRQFTSWRQSISKRLVLAAERAETNGGPQVRALPSAGLVRLQREM